jgi:hypothetical protein
MKPIHPKYKIYEGLKKVVDGESLRLEGIITIWPSIFCTQ